MENMARYFLVHQEGVRGRLITAVLGPRMEILERITRGEVGRRSRALEETQIRSRTILCGAGQTAPNLQLTTIASSRSGMKITYISADYLYSAAQLTFTILDNCGCYALLPEMSVNAIRRKGQGKKNIVIDQESA